MADDATSVPGGEAITSVTAHALLNSLAVAKAAVATLRLHWDELDEEARRGLLARVEGQMASLGESLADLVRGIPVEARGALDALEASE